MQIQYVHMATRNCKFDNTYWFQMSSIKDNCWYFSAAEQNDLE